MCYSCFFLKYVRVKELKTDFHIPYTTELFYLCAPVRKAGKITTKNVRPHQMVKKKFKLTVSVLGFKLSSSFILGTKGLDPQKFIFLKPI